MREQSLNTQTEQGERKEQLFKKQNNVPQANAIAVCCSPSEQATCCELTVKATCCVPSSTECGCR